MVGDAEYTMVVELVIVDDVDRESRFRVALSSPGEIDAEVIKGIASRFAANAIDEVKAKRELAKRPGQGRLELIRD